MSWTFTTSGAIMMKAGANANQSSNISGALVTWSDEAEAFICDTTKTDYVSSYSSLDTTKKKILGDVASSYAAMNVISYDMSGYTSRLEAQTMLDVLNDKIVKGLKVLEDKDKRNFIDGA